MAVTVDQAKLVLNTFAAIFQNNLMSAEVGTWGKFNSEMNDRNALTVVEQIGPRFAVTQTVNGVADLTTGTQDAVFGSEQFIVNRVFGSSMGWGDFSKIRDLGDARESVAITNAATQLAERIDAYIMGIIGLQSNNWTGTAGNTIASFNDVAAGYTRLKEEGVDDRDMRAVLNFSDRQALGDWIVNNNDSALAHAEGVYRKGFDGTVAGIPTAFTQQLPSLTVGTRPPSGANVQVNGAGQNVNYTAAVAVSAAPGQYLTQTINIRVSAAGTETVNDGEVFTIAGVNAFDNRAGVSLGRPQQFRVLGNYTAVAGAISNMRIFPAIIVPGTGAGVQININNAHATVDSVPGAAALITFLGAASAIVRPRFIAQKDAIVINTADLIMPATGVAARKSLTKVPLSVRMWKNSNFATGQHDVRFDVALTANVRDRRRVVRINGA